MEGRADERNKGGLERRTKGETDGGIEEGRMKGQIEGRMHEQTDVLNIRSQSFHRYKPFRVKSVESKTKVIYRTKCSLNI